MISGKAAYLNRLYEKTKFMRTVEKDHIEGSSPPSVFIGKFGYPKVSVGPLVPEAKGRTEIMDLPEEWLNSSNEAADIAAFRFQLLRGKQNVKINDIHNPIVEKTRDIALAKKSVDVEMAFKKKPRGIFINENMQPFGPSAPIKTVDIGNVKFEKKLEKAYHDTDLLARDAIIWLHNKGLYTSVIQKALSVGSFGLGRNRKLVPTRWSITAVDDTLGKDLLEKIRHYPVIDSYKIYEFEQMNNKFIVMLTPNYWQYEFLEAFIHVFGKEEMLFSDYENYEGRKDYASIGGCYYSTRLALTEFLEKEKKQAGAIVFRESYPGYVPLGVWLVRECSRKTVKQKPKEFDNLTSALNYISSRLWLPMNIYRKQSALLKQRRLNEFLAA